MAARRAGASICKRYPVRSPAAMHLRCLASEVLVKGWPLEGYSRSPATLLQARLMKTMPLTALLLEALSPGQLWEQWWTLSGAAQVRTGLSARVLFFTQSIRMPYV